MKWLRGGLALVVVEGVSDSSFISNLLSKKKIFDTGRAPPFFLNYDYQPHSVLAVQPCDTRTSS